MGCVEEGGVLVIISNYWRGRGERRKVERRVWGSSSFYREREGTLNTAWSTCENVSAKKEGTTPATKYGDTSTT